MAYVNQFKLAPQGSAEVIRRTFRFDELPSGVSSNIIVSCSRINSSGASVDISTKASISDQTVTLADIFLGAEARTSGAYRIKIVVRDSASSVILECNGIVTVLS